MGKRIFLTEEQFKNYIRYQRSKMNLLETVDTYNFIKEGIRKGKDFTEIYEDISKDKVCNITEVKKIYNSIK